jgi:hypothetical protein
MHHAGGMRRHQRATDLDRDLERGQERDAPVLTDDISELAAFDQLEHHERATLGVTAAGDQARHVLALHRIEQLRLTAEAKRDVRLRHQRCVQHLQCDMLALLGGGLVHMAHAALRDVAHDLEAFDAGADEISVAVGGYCCRHAKHTRCGAHCLRQVHS